jgi:hypothetical protein
MLVTLSLKGDIVTLHYQNKLRGVPFDPTHYKSTLETADELMDQRGRLIQLPVLRPTGAEDLRAAEERELKAADKLLLALYRCGKQSSARAAAETAGLGKTTGCDAIKDLITPIGTAARTGARRASASSPGRRKQACSIALWVT